jgi:phosphoribosyl 1,2-cyclic phosphodiesterase
MATEISVRFLGVRAFHSTPGRKNQTTGGNTGCIEIRDGQQRILINAGFGINAAGDELLSQYIREKVPTNCTILFSDFFWDSMMGLPFFTPIHFKSTELDILSGAPAKDAKSGIDDVASNLFSPFNGVKGFRSDLSIRQLDGIMRRAAWQINALPLPHPLAPYPVTVWRLTHDGGADIGIVMVCDQDAGLLSRVSEFLAGCKTLICAASKSPTSDGWDRHRTNFDDALGLATTIAASELFLTQFHPAMTDVMLQSELMFLRQKHQHLMADEKLGVGPLQIHLGSEMETITPIFGTKPSKAG